MHEFLERAIVRLPGHVRFRRTRKRLVAVYVDTRAQRVRAMYEAVAGPSGEVSAPKVRTEALETTEAEDAGSSASELSAIRKLRGLSPI